MVRLLLLFVCGAFAALGLLTVVKAPDWVPWEASVLAAEYGYLVAVVPLLIFVFTLFGSGFRAGLIRVLGLGAVVLLVQPCFRAWWIGRGLRAEMGRAFGPVAVRDEPFRWERLLGSGPRSVPFETFTFDESKAPPLALDFYRAVGRHGAAPCVIVIHGGGWDNGERGQIATLNWGLARAGYAVADISYRLAPKNVWPAPRDDVGAAVAFLRGRAVALGVDPHRIVLLGRSAGGQIAEAAGYAATPGTFCGVVGLYAPADMHFAYRYGREDDSLKSPALLRAFLGGPPAQAAAAYDSASGYLLVHPRVPPTLLVHGELDALVWYRQSERLAAKLAAEHARAYFLSLPWATHAVEYRIQGPSGQLTWFALEYFLAAATK